MQVVDSKYVIHNFSTKCGAIIETIWRKTPSRVTLAGQNGTVRPAATKGIEPRISRIAWMGNPSFLIRVIGLPISAFCFLLSAFCFFHKFFFIDPARPAAKMGALEMVIHANLSSSTERKT
jgi:hypothetical protein